MAERGAATLGAVLGGSQKQEKKSFFLVSELNKVAKMMNLNCNGCLFVICCLNMFFIILYSILRFEESL